MHKKKINVTSTYLPPLNEYIEKLKIIWANKWITNHGPMVKELELRLKKYFDVKYLFFVSNGTVALEIAIKTLNLTGEIITTPFSYVATTSSIVWMNCKPVFVDIDPHSLCVDVNKIEKTITKKTSAILLTHVYGNACDLDKVNSIAKKHKLKVIYDAAHCFGVRYRNQSILNYGDISTLSFHATKLFHTVEGGAIITNNKDLAHKISYHRNFGHNGQEAFWGLGINGKNSEIHAAMGLSILPVVRSLIKKRKLITKLYDKLLIHPSIDRVVINHNISYNYAYYPVIFSSKEINVKIIMALNKEGYYPRRYFYPSLNKLPYVIKTKSPVSDSVSERVLCLPIFPELSHVHIKNISEIILENL